MPKLENIPNPITAKCFGYVQFKNGHDMVLDGGPFDLLAMLSAYNQGRNCVTKIGRQEIPDENSVSIDNIVLNTAEGLNNFLDEVHKGTFLR